MATKEHRRSARQLIEGLESRVHRGPPIGEQEIGSAHEFLRQCSFPPASDYFNRLTEIQNRLAGRSRPSSNGGEKRNYGGKAAGRWLQVQSIHDHLILSTCYEGEFNLKRGRIKISHRFNSEGRVDFVELKFLRSMSPCLTGEIRKLVLVRNFQDIARGWHEAEAFTLGVLPQELIFLFADIFRCPKNEILAGLINIGHGMTGDLLAGFNSGTSRRPATQNSAEPEQLGLTELRADEVAMPILERAVGLEAVVELSDDKSVVIRYHRI